MVPDLVRGSADTLRKATASNLGLGREEGIRRSQGYDEVSKPRFVPLDLLVRELVAGNIEMVNASLEILALKRLVNADDAYGVRPL